MSDRTCGTDGCERKRHARGLCASCYAKQYKAKRATKRDCAYCSTTFRAYHPDTECCSNTCTQRHRFGWAQSTEVVLAPPMKVTQSTPRTVRASRWYGCTCAICGERFIAKGYHATCSDPCRADLKAKSKRAERIRYKQARGRFAVPDSVRFAIYERDGWACQICSAPTSRAYTHGDHRSPTLDHIIPQSWQTVPDHSPSNLRLACALCNAIRGDRPGSDQEVARRATQEVADGLVNQRQALTPA